ncbi:MAG TPA: hypothetical protein VGM19_08265 [Armatimonadota bacterium]|jgi:hypothetical protein
MSSTSRVRFLLTVLCAGLALPVLAQTTTLRGFGAVSVSSQFFGPEATRSSWITFSTEDPTHAALLGSKYLADLLGFGDLQLQPAGPSGTVVTLAGVGFWRLGLEGSNCHVLFARTLPELTALAGRAKAETWKPIPSRAYPRWLDCFDNAGPGIWWGGGGAPVTIPDDFQWVKDRGFALCDQPPTESRYVAPGVIDTSITDWFGAMAKRYDLPYRTLLWVHKPEWAWNRQPLPYVLPAPGMVVQPDMRFERLSLMDVFEPVPATDRYTLDFRQRFAAGLNEDPNFLAGHALGEVPDAGVMELSAVAGMPEVKALWHSYLVSLGLSLEQVGRLHQGRGDFYRSWEEVAVPTPRDFMGFDAGSVDLAGPWEGLPDREKAGTAAQWYVPASMPTEGWRPVQSNDPLLLIYGGGAAPAQREKRADYWLRRTVTLTAAQCASLQYLLVGRAIWHGPYSTYCDAYLNGQPLTQSPPEQGRDLALSFDVRGLLHAGDNQLVLCSHGGPPASFITLGNQPLRRYPLMSGPENRLWYDATNFSAWLRMQTLENNLKAMRAGDPNRPLKVMATINLLDLSQDLCARYGAYQHDTGGAGGYWAPMTGARLARTHGLPWSCEQGGPPADAAAMQAAMTFYLMYGNDAVDLVFGVTHYKDKPDVAAWVDKNLALMQCIGKMHLPLPPVGILRSTRATRLGFSEPWNWDVGRGVLQGIGRNFAYVEVPDILNGAINQFPVVIDDGTVLLTQDEIEGLQRYVRAGGIFIAQHHTGRHLPERADAWALAAACGLTVTPKLINAENYHQWPLGKIRFTADEDLLPSLRGKQVEGSGVAIDYLQQAHTGAVGLEGHDPSIRPVALWDDGTMAVADIHLGRGRLIYLGTPFYLRMRDQQGQWVNQKDLQVLLDEMLTGLGVPRDSWTGVPEIWAEHWTSKNGVFDLYPVARMAKSGDDTASATVSLRRATPLRELVEVTGNGHPRSPVTWKDGRMTLPATGFGQMQSRMYAAPRADLERSALNWWGVQQEHWRALPPLSPLTRPQVIETPADVVPVAEGWRMAQGQTGDAWKQAGFADTEWKTVKLGSFAALGLPEDSVAQFRHEIPVPASWKGQRVNLVFNAEWSYGVEQGRLWINGAPAALRQPLRAYGATSFTLDVTEAAAAGQITLALEIDGHQPDATKPRARPAGVTGLFYLQALPTPVTTTPLAGPWFAATDVNVLTPVEVGQPATFTYLETRFTLPKPWPAPRVFVETPGPLGWIILNDHVVQAPDWMKTLDVSGLVRPDGENVLRWVPAPNQTPDFQRPLTQPVPEMHLNWLR